MGTIDRAQLLRDLKTLEDSEFVVLTGQIDDQAHGHEIAAELAAEADLPELSYIFIHRQTIERSFHAGGSLRAPVQLHWGGSYDLILDRLAYLPEPWVALDFGEAHAFEVTVPEVGFEDVIELPEPDSPVREIRSAATQLSDAGEMNDDALEWIVEVLGSGSPKAQAAVLDVASQRLRLFSKRSSPPGLTPIGPMAILPRYASFSTRSSRQVTTALPKSWPPLNVSVPGPSAGTPPQSWLSAVLPMLWHDCASSPGLRTGAMAELPIRLRCAGISKCSQPKRTSPWRRQPSRSP
ncbi:hypothetical protein [Brevibacterium otitidis]|uniref:Uncharacterized protein n=1 Tax=Brevibacterium otitidis TaxID=53364 RepID=A0ABV5WYM0_9MICO|nr:hypothetical protein GCM10023233_18790 [Brevibacterium otitidis]